MQIDVLTRGELEADAERPRHLAGRRIAQVGAAGQPDEWQLVVTEPLDRAIAATFSAWLVSSQFAGSRLRRAKSTIRRVASDDCGPMMSMPTPARLCSPSRRATNVESSRSLSGPSSNSSVLSCSRSTAM